MRHSLLRKLAHFTRLSKADEEMLTRIGTQRTRRFVANEDIIREGEKPEFISLVNEGWACRYKMLEDGRRQIVAFLLPGDLCDVHATILKEMDHSIAALTPVVLSEISHAAFEEMMMAQPRLTQAMWWESLVAAGIQREWTVNLGQRHALERVAHLLCELFIRLEVAGMANGQSCEFPLTQTELGETVGLSTVHVNRTLQDLRAMKLIVLKERTLTILDLDALKSLALFNPNYLHLQREGRHLDANEE